MPDILGIGPYVVSERVAELIESMQEVGCKSIPILLMEEPETPVPAQYYALYLPIFVDCIDMEQTHWRRGYGIKAAMESGFRTKLGGDYFLRSGAVRGHHIWRAAMPGGSLYFISDELRDLFVHHSVTGWEYLKCRLSP